MEPLKIDPEIIDGLIKVRQDLLFWLTEQNGPTRDLAKPLWEAFQLIVNGLEEIERVTGFVEQYPEWPKEP